MISITGIGVFTQHIPTYGALLGYTTAETGNALAYASIGSAAGSIAIGVISDRIGSLKTCYGVLGIGFLAMAGYLLSGQQSPPLSHVRLLPGINQRRYHGPVPYSDAEILRPEGL